MKLLYTCTVFGVLAAFIVVGCSSSPDKTSCDADDRDCLLDNIVVEQDGQPVKLVALPGGSLTVPNATTGSNVPAISNQPDSMIFGDTKADQDLVIDWTDPYGAQPALCISLCPKDVQCFASRPWQCTPFLKDGKTSGTWRSSIGFSTRPTGGAQFSINVVPVTSTNGQNPLPYIGEEGKSGQVITGVGVTIGAQIVPPDNPANLGNSTCVGGAQEVQCSCGSDPCPTVTTYQFCYNTGYTMEWVEDSSGERFNCAAPYNCGGAIQNLVTKWCPGG
jgi:hypothetical protein